MIFDLAKAILFPSKRTKYLSRALGKSGAADPALLLPTLQSAGITSLGYDYLNRYPMLLDVRGRSITEEVLRTGSFQFGLFEIIARIYPRRDVCFINVGANIGTSILNAHAIGFREIIAFEPVHDNFTLLQQNVARLDGSFDLRPMAVGYEAGKARINLNLTSIGRHSLVKDFGQGAQDVDVVTLDEVLPKKRGLLWVDTEGFELNVLRGAERYLADFADGICLEITPELLGDDGVEEVQTILSRHFSNFYTADGTHLKDFNLVELAAGQQLDLIAIKAS